MEIRLRQYKSCDADTIAGWIQNEEILTRWSLGRFGRYPISGADINDKYGSRNGDCMEPDNFYPMTALDDDGPAGHFILRYTDEEKRVLRLGYVIVDDSKRGRGYGKKMLSLAIKYAFDIMKAEKITIGVLDNNEPARHCYESVGLRETGRSESITIRGESRKILELEMTSGGFLTEKSTENAGKGAEKGRKTETKK